MEKTLLFLDANSGLSLQAQIRQKLVEAITLGTFPPERRLPSSRKLAQQLGVARNTVVLVYEQLVEEGYLVSRERSGIYISEAALKGRIDTKAGAQSNRASLSHWRQRFKASPAGREPYLFPPNWSLHPYPFLEGKFDASLFPVKEWREASRLALGVRDINAWSEETGDADDPMLVEEIRTKILPRRGIQALPEEILVTVGSRQAMHLAVQLLVDSTITVAVEDPGTPVMRQMLAQRGASMIYQPVDEEGIVVDSALDDAQLLYVTPSHQIPTSVTMSLARRQSLLAKAGERDQLIIEDDTEFENNYIGQPHPALRSMDQEGRVIYFSCLSKVLDTGLCVGFIVAAPEFIAEARKLRRLAVNHPPPNNQRAAAYFLSLGNYDSFLMHMHQRFGERWKALQEALSLYLLHFVESTSSQGGTSVWIQGPPEIEMSELVNEAARRGILIEPVSHYYANPPQNVSYFRMSITSIGVGKIREGVERLSDLIHELTSDRFETLEHARGRCLSAAEITDLFSGATVFWKTINGDPATIDYMKDGRAEGRIGYANEDRGEGQWWVKGDLWYRQWERWYFGEPLGFHVVVDGSTLKLFEEDGQLSDIGVLHIPDDESETIARD
ncbi:MAG: PLP-dependent aminotransferase family protein [Halieaceae bacterium]|jgi:GntR family transcriptional regulator / MocR family aminotransferase|nr:PLP-dependent aminotransferase family protein [Halieaceae bacterium]